ncbi:hypothetical protein ACHHYP_02503 [Achlya hypogyna]|uniref:Uncharacterized protein n=1 Tax=Achlya hypogyna TaxID=1202772 RepID=A0A1V9Z685_ACHHY|nr:hypothetical protein ACHHYP_02503 [Achlya hypogyna]
MELSYTMIQALSKSALVASSPGLQAWYTMEELVAKYQHRSVLVRAVAFKRAACHKAVTLVFPPKNVPGLATEAQYAQKMDAQLALLQRLRDLLRKVHSITTLLFDMAELWRAIKRTEVNAMFENARMDVVIAATAMEDDFIGCSTHIHEDVILPLEFKLRKLEELEVDFIVVTTLDSPQAFIRVREDIKVALDSAQRKLSKAKAKSSLKVLEERKLEHKQAKADLVVATDCLQAIFAWLADMQSELTRPEVDELLRTMKDLFQRSADVWCTTPGTPP